MSLAGHASSAPAAARWLAGRARGTLPINAAQTRAAGHIRSDLRCSNICGSLASPGPSQRVAIFLHNYCISSAEQKRIFVSLSTSFKRGSNFPWKQLLGYFIISHYCSPSRFAANKVAAGNLLEAIPVGVRNCISCDSNNGVCLHTDSVRLNELIIPRWRKYWHLCWKKVAWEH